MTRLDIITGFLGAGKTTFIQSYLLACKRRGERVVYLVNDFGEQPIDDLLVQGEAYVLGGGCVCCSLKVEFVRTLQEILAAPAPDRILFEPSGLFMMSDILNDVRKLPDLKLHAVVTVLDGHNFMETYTDFGLFLDNQMRYASEIIVNKGYDEASKTYIEQKVRELNADARLQFIDLLEQPVPGFKLKSVNDTVYDKAQPHFAPECYSVIVDKKFGPLLLKKLKNCFAGRQFGDVIRAKGILKGQQEDYIFNVVNNEYTVEKVSVNTNYPTGRIAVMGKNLHAELLERIFE